MARYYLVPNETDKEKMRGIKKCPKYLDLIGASRGITDWNDTTGKEYYLVIVEDDKQDMTKLEECSDVKKIDTTFLTKTNIESLGISVLSTKPSQDDLEKLLIKWLTGDDEKTLRTI